MVLMPNYNKNLSMIRILTVFAFGIIFTKRIYEARTHAFRRSAARPLLGHSRTPS
jgi:hypothetical protein